MSFLPFVLSFLLILVVGSGLLFQTFKSTAVEKTVILSRNEAHLSLRSEQAKKQFKALQASAQKEKKASENLKKVTTQVGTKIKEYVQKRDLRRNFDSSKFNLWPLVFEPDSVASKVLYKKAIALIEILYGDTDFYKSSRRPNLATALIDSLLGKKEETFQKLFPEDPELSAAFLKMLRGKNTGYPHFEEYFSLKECKNKPPICFPSATTPVLTAILGAKITHQILEQEKKKWETKPKERTLTQEELRQLIQKNSTEGFDLTHFDSLFSFDKPQNELPKAFVDEKTKIMSMD
jgi:hypothetical protein